MQFHCPLDGEILNANEAVLKCANGHSFDISKEGYCNLLLVQQKASLNPGDNKEMVEARRRFLAAEFFEPIALKIEEYAQSLASKMKSPCIVDAGCGEGYYLGRLQQALPHAELTGIDISKWAIKAAAKSHKRISWAVASNKQLPFAKDSVAMILCAFGFPFWESFQSALAKDGYLLLIDPAPEHLCELRELIYEKVKANDLSNIDGALTVGFSLVKEETLTFAITLEQNSAIQDLLAMTPHGHRIKAEAREALMERKELTTKVSVVFRLLRKN